jgi:hypothetical protein
MPYTELMFASLHVAKVKAKFQTVGKIKKTSIISMMILVMVFLSARGTLADLQIDANYDGGSIGSYSIDNVSNEIEFEVVSDALSYEYWTNFKVSDVLDKEVTFRITNANQVPFLTSTTDEAQLVYCCDGENWYRLTDHSYSSDTYTFTETFVCDEVQIATFFPFSYEKMSGLVDAVSASQWAQKTVLGSSYQGRDIDLLTITNDAILLNDKKIIYIIGRQHAAETASSHMLEGMIDFLISNDVNACRFRNNYVWYIVPMVNPDGVYLGNSRANSKGNDPNRDWHPNNHDSVEIDIVRAHIVEINSTTAIDLFIDWHSQMNDDKWYNFVYSPKDNTFFDILSDWTDFDSQMPSEASSCKVRRCSCRGYITTYVLFDPTFVFEPTPHLVSWTKDSLNAEGVNTAFAISEYFGMFEGSLMVVFAVDFGRTDCSSDCEDDFDTDGDVDGSDLATFAADVGRTNCP